jgi:hypothetical protein
MIINSTFDTLGGAAQGPSANRQEHVKGRTVPDLTLDPDLAPVQLDDLPHDWQPEACPFNVA